MNMAHAHVRVGKTGFADRLRATDATSERCRLPISATASRQQMRDWPWPSATNCRPEIFSPPVSCDGHAELRWTGARAQRVVAPAKDVGGPTRLCRVDHRQGGAKVMVTVVQCIKKRHRQTTPSAHETACHMHVWIFVHEEDFQANPHGASDNKERSADSARNRSIIFSLPLAFAFATWSASIRNLPVVSRMAYPPCQPKPLRPNRCRTNRRCAGPFAATRPRALRTPKET